MSYLKHEVPSPYLLKWQLTVNLMAKIFGVSSGLIMRVLPEEIEVLISSNSKSNPYTSLERADLNTGLYCETVMSTQSQLQVVNALTDTDWNKNPDLKLNMVSYLGVPLIWPDGNVFGTICVLDERARAHSKLYQELLWQFKEAIEVDFQIIVQAEKILEYQNQLEEKIQIRTLELKEINAKLQVELDERRQLEAKLLQAQKMEAIGVLTGGIAHEFNNLLSPILGYTELLLTDKHENSLNVDSLEQVHKAGSKAKYMIQKLLTYGRRSLSNQEPVNIEKILEDTIALLEITIPTNVAIHKDIEIGLPPIYAVPSEIQQVFINLCINASQSMLPSGGICKVNLNYMGSHSFIGPDGNSRSGDFVCLSVKDTGCGIDKSIQDRIFDPFFTTKGVGYGSGLGLSVVHGIVEQHNGYIEVKSSVGIGTTFCAYFPVSEEQEISSVVKNIALERETEERGTEHILIIDDEQMIIHLIKCVLEKLGYKVTTFLDSVKALKYFSKYNKDFSLVITDYGMFNMNGRQLAGKLKNISPNIPIMLLTGYHDLDLEKDLDKWGIDYLLKKPANIEELCKTVKTLCNKKTPD